MSLRRPTVACLLFIYSLYALYVVSLRRPTVACLLFLLFISPLCGVAQTPDWGMIYLITFRGVASDTRSVHSITTPVLHIRILYEHPPCVHHGFYLFRDWHRDHRIFQSMIIILLYYARVLNVCEYIQKYSLACPWLLSWPDYLLGEERCDDIPGT